MRFKKLVSILLTCCMVFSVGAVSAVTTSAAQDTTATLESAAAAYGLADNVQDGVILHAWNWSYNNIKAQIPLIAASGYSAVQTSPVTQAKDYLWEGKVTKAVGSPNGNGGHHDGNWWKVYQPVTMSICDNGNTWFGTKAEFEEMCAEAHKYGVKVLVDIVANHLGNIKGWQNALTDVSPQIGEFWEPAMLTDPTYWHINNMYVHDADARKPVTQGCMGMPDLNTGDKRVQNMVLGLLNECIEAGADGFRFDAAKHIEMPEDDPEFASDFWPYVLDGARATYRAKTGRDLYVYGEILNRNDGIDPVHYTKRMSVTNNAYGDNKRNDARYGNAGSLASGSTTCDYITSANKALVWAESHDTYMGGGSSYLATDDMIKQTWAIVGTRLDTASLYFARTYTYEERFADGPGDVLKQKNIGDVGTMTWAEKSVAEINKFHNYFIGKSESLGSDGSNTAYNVRGSEGVVISKLNGAGSVSLDSRGMKNGTYTDQVGGGTFTVSGGKISGTVSSADGIAVVYNAQAKPANTISKQGGTFKDSVTITLGLENATSGTYQIGNEAVQTYTGTKTLTLGAGLAGGASVKLTLTATNGSQTTEISYTFTKEKEEKPTDPPTPPPTTAPPTNPGVQLMRGDANGDKRVDLRDLLTLQKHIAKLDSITERNFPAADVNGDDKISLNDIIYVQRHLVGFPNTYNIGEYFIVGGGEPISTEPPTQENTTQPITTPNPDTKTIYVGLVYYLNDTMSPPKINYGSGDAMGTATGKTISASVGSEFWGGAAQVFHIYEVTVPNSAATIRFRNTADSNTWYGENITLGSANDCYLLFEYGGQFRNANSTFTP